MKNEHLDSISISDLSTVAGGFVSDLRNTRAGVNAGGYLGGLAGHALTSRALEKYVGPGVATAAGMAVGLGGSVLGGVTAGAVGLGRDIYESATGRPLR